jgi:transposase
LDLRGSIPTFIWITEGKIHDVKALDILIYETNAYYIFDRGYLDFERLYKITLVHVVFVTPLKSNSQYRRVHSNPSDHVAGIISDQIIIHTETEALKNYPDKLRRIHYLDIEHGIHYDFLTNNFEISALTIAKYTRRDGK